MTDSLSLNSPQLPLLQYQKAAYLNMDVRKNRRRKQHAKMVIFVDVVLQYLQALDPSKVQGVKAIIRDSIQRNRNGEPDTSPLHSYLLQQIKTYVGPRHWELSNKLFRDFMEAKKTQHKQRRIQQWRLLLEKRKITSLVSSVEDILSVPI